MPIKADSSTNKQKRIFPRATESWETLPNLIEIQTKSYDWFFKEGLQELLGEISPIEDFTGELYSLSFGKYYLEDPKIDEKTACE